MVSIIIPAYNEARTIGDLIDSVKRHPDVSEVIVIDDGSKDDTRVIAATHGAKVVHLQKNEGKASAMDAGVREASNEVILFLDADVLGFNDEKLSTIIDPVIKGELEMHVGILPRFSLLLLSKKVFYILPVLSGMRALTKTLWNRVPRSQRDGFKIELALNHAARKWGRGTGYEIIPGLIHSIKEKKYGIMRGSWRRVIMMMQLVSISFRLYIGDPLVDLIQYGKNRKIDEKIR